MQLVAVKNLLRFNYLAKVFCPNSKLRLSRPAWFSDTGTSAEKKELNEVGSLGDH